MARWRAIALSRWELRLMCHCVRSLQKDPLPTQFTCLFCNHEKSVTVKLDKKAGVGLLDCKVCGQRFQCAINCRRAPWPATGMHSASRRTADARNYATRPFRRRRRVWRVG